MCPHSEFSWSVFTSNARNKDQKNSKYEHFSSSVFQEAVLGKYSKKICWKTSVMFYKNSVLIISKQNITKTHSMQSLLSCRHTTCYYSVQGLSCAFALFSLGTLFIPSSRIAFCMETSTEKKKILQTAKYTKTPSLASFWCFYC